ncbi:MAG TPA: class I SAM-dependent methyltransferase [Pricia sp.]|nr:class I SAM-dependent methyltransferase [Pricia sp.]
MKFRALFLLIFLISFASCFAQVSGSDAKYIFKDGNPNGIGKWYLGREIAHVMGYQGMKWLERDNREDEENTSKLLRNMDIAPGDTIADIGAGSGHHVFRMAPLVEEGLVYAVDIQDEMLAALRKKKDDGSNSNIQIVKGSEKSVNLPEDSVDKALMVDVYHEFSFPVEMIASIEKALRPDGQIYLIEYRAEDPDVPIKRLHKMSERQAVKEMETAGFKLKRNLDNLPWQHCMIFIRK